MNKVNFIEKLNSFNMFNVEQVSFEKFKSWKSTDGDGVQVNHLLELSMNGKGFIFKDKYELNRNMKEIEALQNLEDRFFTYVYDSIFKKGLTEIFNY